MILTSFSVLSCEASFALHFMVMLKAVQKEEIRMDNLVKFHEKEQYFG